MDLDTPTDFLAITALILAITVTAATGSHWRRPANTAKVFQSGFTNSATELAFFEARKYRPQLR
jgi:hypothetical protein